MKKIIEIDTRAERELSRFPKAVQREFQSLLEILEQAGKLDPPCAKKITKDLFEIRVRYQGQWRALYAYLKHNAVIILSAFRKKTQTTPLKEIHKAEHRLQQYLFHLN